MLFCMVTLKTIWLDSFPIRLRNDIIPPCPAVYFLYDAFHAIFEPRSCEAFMNIDTLGDYGFLNSSRKFCN